jgi:hypothetical protein
MLRVRYQKAKIQTANKKPGGGLAPRRAFEFGAGNETRTRDPDLGKVVLYQLSYSRFEGAYFKHIGGCVNVNLH